MMQSGAPRVQPMKYETALKVDNCVPLIHATPAAAARARSVLSHVAVDPIDR